MMSLIIRTAIGVFPLLLCGACTSPESRGTRPEPKGGDASAAEMTETPGEPIAGGGDAGGTVGPDATTMDPPIDEPDPEVPLPDIESRLK